MRVSDILTLDDLRVFDAETDAPVRLSGKFELVEIDYGDPSVGIFGDTATIVSVDDNNQNEAGFYVDADELWEHVEPEAWERAYVGDHEYGEESNA